MEEKIMQIVYEECGDERILKDKKVDLIENDLIDSLAFIDIISKIEEEFGIEIQPTEETIDSWRSIESIVNMVKRKLGE